MHGGYTQEEQILKRPLIIQIEAGQVTMHQAEGGPGGEIGEAVGHAIKGIGGVLGCGFILEQPGLHRQRTAVTPMGCDHFLDHAELHAISGPEPFEVVIHDSFVTC